MTRGKKLLALAAALLVIIIAALLISRLSAESESAAEAEDDTSVQILSFSADTLTELEWTYSGESVALGYDGETWSYTADSAFPVDASYPNAIVKRLASLTATRTIESPSDLAQYGLDEPELTVSYTADGESRTVSIGSENAIGGSRYIALDGDANVYLVDSELAELISYGLMDIVQLEEIPDMSDLLSFELVIDDMVWQLDYVTTVTMVDDREMSESTWYLGSTVLDTDAANETAGLITGLQWLTCADYNAADLSDYGLDAPAATVTVTYTDSDDAEQSFTLEIGGEADYGHYARISGSAMVYTIDPSILQQLEALTMDYLENGAEE
ncbi:MAG: DUF4340 domain-containing protein [Oscillospiraceae bacterium]|nr:DUF4340 domain-containing protein [Oscillospiraceae bacterium]